MILCMSIINTITYNPFHLGCIDPSEPFQCPQSERCIALQFVCDHHPGDCPDNLDENEETCIAGRSIFLYKSNHPLFF